MDKLDNTLDAHIETLRYRKGRDWAELVLVYTQCYLFLRSLAPKVEQVDHGDLAEHVSRLASFTLKCMKKTGHGKELVADCKELIHILMEEGEDE